MQYPRLLSCAALALLILPACGGGGGSAPGTQPPPSANAVHLLIDTSTGSGDFLQARLVAASFERADGSLTGNLLSQERSVTFGDPRGTPTGLTLQDVPGGGAFTALRMLFSPGSAIAARPDGSVLPVELPTADLRVALDAPLTPTGTGATWLRLAHRGVLDLRPGASGGLLWLPDLTLGSADGGAVEDAVVEVVALNGTGPVTALLLSANNAPLHLEFEQGAVLTGASGGSQSLSGFLSELEHGSEIEVHGRLDSSGGLRTSRASHRGRGSEDVKYLGQIVGLAPTAGTFELQVQVEIQRGERRPLAQPLTVTVDTSGALIHHDDDYTPLSFADLTSGDLVKVEWTRRQGNVVFATEVEIEHGSGGQNAHPEIEGRVESVRLNERVIVVVPRGNDPVLVMGQSVARAEIHVAPAAVLFRVERNGGQSTTIELSEVNPGQDRIWIRGTATSPTTVEARWVRVRQD